MGVKILGKIKIYEIAKKLGLASKDVLRNGRKIKNRSKKPYEWS